MKKLLLITVVLLFNTVSYAQGCLPEGITFLRQSQVDSFLIVYPTCTVIEGNVTIWGTWDITNLNGLSNITAINGGLTINDSHSLLDFTGLDNLKTIGGDVLIKNNINQVSFSGLENLTTIGGNFDTYQYYNTTLTNFQGLNGLTTIGGYFFISIYSVLENFSGLGNLVSIGNYFHVFYTAIHNFSGLENLSTVGGYIIISGNSNLVDFTGLDGLATVGTHLSVEGNPRLKDLTGLLNLSYVGGNISFYANDSLTSLAGIDNIAAATIDNISIYSNHMLSTCEVKSVCDYLAAPAGNVYITDNATGCNSVEEVQEACDWLPTKDLPAATKLTVHPCPASDIITIETPLPAGRLTIFSTSGREILQSEVTNPKTILDIGPLPPGVYFIRLKNEKMVQISKVIKG